MNECRGRVVAVYDMLTTTKKERNKQKNKQQKQKKERVKVVK